MYVIMHRISMSFNSPLSNQDQAETTSNSVTAGEFLDQQRVLLKFLSILFFNKTHQRNFNLSSINHKSVLNESLELFEMKDKKLNCCGAAGNVNYKVKIKISCFLPFPQRGTVKLKSADINCRRGNNSGLIYYSLVQKEALL